MILDELDYEYGITQPIRPSDPVPPAPFASTPGSSGSGGSGSWSRASSSSSRPETWIGELAALRNKLLPLVASEDALASELSGGINVTGGKSGVFMRAGWQALVTSRGAIPIADVRTMREPGKNTGVTNIVAKTLAACQGEIHELWRHPAVKALLKTNKLRLEEYAAL